jgi:hypothetical protein
MADCHELYLWQDILRTVIGTGDTAHTQYEADCLDWQSLIDDGHELLSKADMLQLKEFCDNNYLLCKDDYDPYKEWSQVIVARPRNINIMSGLIIDKDERAWNNDKNWFDDYSDNDRRQAFFLLHHQVLTYHQWLSYCPEEAAFFWNFEVSKSVCLALIMKMILKEYSQRWYAYRALTTKAPGFPLTTGLNGLKVNYKLGREIAAKMTVDGFAAPVLNPNTANVTQARGAGGDNMWWWLTC